MAIITEAEVRTVYDTASAQLKTYIDSDELMNTFDEIRTTHKLHVDQAGNLAMLIDAIILEMHPFANFPALLKDALINADAPLLAAVQKDVNDKVFVVFREKMKALTTPPPVVAAPLSQPAAARPISVMEQKMASVAAPEPIVQKVPPPAAPEDKPPMPVSASAEVKPATAPAPKAPPNYHAGDPYREPVE